MSWISKRYAGLIFLFVASLLFPVFAFAQTPTGELRLTTSPLPVNLHVTPGSSVSSDFKIKNDGTSAETLKVSLMKFKADPVTGATQLLDREPTDSYFDWVTFSEPTFTLPSNGWKTISATFNVPSTAAFDYYYAVVFLRANQDVKPGERQTVLNGGTATLVLLTADVPNAKKELSLDRLTVDRNIFEFLPAAFGVTVKNTGNVHIIPHGDIFITRGNATVATIPVNDTQGSVLPGSPRTFVSQWSDGFPVYVNREDNGKTVRELTWNFADAAKLRFGKYTAKLVLVYDDGQRDVPVESEVSFWVIPWRIIGGGMLNIVLVVGLIWYVIRLRRRLKKLQQK